MTVRFDSSSDSLNRTSNLLTYTSVYTAMCWAYIAVDTNADTTIFSVNDNSLNNFDLFGHDGTGTTIRLGSRSSAGIDISTGSVVSVGVWVHYCMRRNSATSIELFVDGVTDISNTLDVSSRPASANEIVGFQVGGVTPFNGRVHALKEWDGVALTTAEIRTEMNAVRPIRLANLLNFTPILAGTTGRIRAYNGIDWTANGTLTDEAPPPIGWGNSTILNPFVAAAPPSSLIPVIMNQLRNQGIS